MTKRPSDQSQWGFRSRDFWNLPKEDLVGWDSFVDYLEGFVLEWDSEVKQVSSIRPWPGT